MHSSLLVAAAMLLAGGAQAQPLGLKFSHFLGPTSFFQHDVAEPFAKELEAKSGGRAKGTIYNASSPLGKPTEQASQAKAGTVDISLGLRGAEGEKFPGSSIIELPFVVPRAARGSSALWELYRDGTLAQEYAEYKLLALFVHNPGLIHTADKRVVTLADLKG